MSPELFIKAERMLVDARRELVEFAQEIGQGKWAGQEAEAAMRAHAIGQAIGEAIPLVRELREALTNNAPSIGLH